MSIPQRTVIAKKQWYNYTDSGLYVWGENFGKNVSTHEAILGIDEGELELIQDSITAYQASLDELAAAKAAYEAAVITKDTKRAEMIDTNRVFVGQFQNNPLIPVEVFELLDIPEKAKPGPRSAPVSPSSLVAVANADSSVILSWDTTGNSASTTYTIQASEGAGWSNVWSGTRKRVKLTGYTPGVTVLFRVIAIRNNTESLPSNTAGIYQSGNSGETLEIAA